VLEFLFPGLKPEEYRLTSPASRAYNCIAWAAGDISRWWWPDADPDTDSVYWPSEAPREETIEAFLTAFATLGYAPCDRADPEPGFEKIALYALLTGVPTHAARLLPSGSWTSKLGTMEDLEHTLSSLEGTAYGHVVRILRRPFSSPPTEAPS
jgi:hypothetical protein